MLMHSSHIPRMSRCPVAGEVICYGEGEKPPVGQGLNMDAEITLFGVHKVGSVIFQRLIMFKGLVLLMHVRSKWLLSFGALLPGK